ncbi:unnamed protein product [Meganyctiphanes norvegica]|uniref:Uncharacterized protein n=1 Tax=Meganyctiphanes norvegica TaxID=48144 RepID=A0AAV2SN53_MEGNR
MLHTRTITFTLIILTFITKHGCKKLPYGSPCKWSKDCRDGSWDDFANIGGGRFFNPYTMDGDSICNESRCKCKDFIQSREWKNNNYVCIHFHFESSAPLL